MQPHAEVAATFSGNEIKRLGKRLRDGSYGERDIEVLEEFRNAHDPLLIHMACIVDGLFAADGLKVILSGRMKRTKSIIRKLQRPQNAGMDLSRMGDIVGFRAIVDTVENQDRALRILSQNLIAKDISDYRNSDRLYRSIHVIVRDEQRLLEIQLRTLPQHLWAVESENFGEQTKEGNMSGKIRAYLEALSVASHELDSGKRVTDRDFADVNLFEERAPISGLFQRLEGHFATATLERNPCQTGNTFVVVFDNDLGQLLHRYHFDIDDRATAIDVYRRTTHSLPDVRFETLLFNSGSAETLAVTHPRFFV